MTTDVRERRQSARQLMAALKRELNDVQLETLSGLENFGWELKFVRRKLFAPSVAVVMDGDSHSLAILEPDGSINAGAALEIRKD
jgi:hypothetical protein